MKSGPRGFAEGNSGVNSALLLGNFAPAMEFWRQIKVDGCYPIGRR